VAILEYLASYFWTALLAMMTPLKIERKA